MKNSRILAGIFVVSALVLFSAALFFIGDRHKAFTRHANFYTEITDVNGLQAGSKVRVSGFEAGQVTGIQIPDQPSGKFRFKLHVDDKLHNLIRQDSLVTIETDGLVGDKFLLIHNGSAQSPEATDGATLPSKEPIEMSAVIAKMTGVMDQAQSVMGQANSAIGDVKVKIDGALDAVTNTVNNTNGIVTGVRQGKGTIGMLLNDEQTSSQVKLSVANVQQASANLNQVSVQAKQVMTDFQSRDLFQKADDTLNNAKEASQQLNQASQQVNTTLTEALGPDHSGEDAAENIRETLSNMNVATSNVADDTEALKHNFLFRGFFKKRGFYDLHNLNADQYRSDTYFQDASAQRNWVNATDAFTNDSLEEEMLSPAGERQIDEIVGGAKATIANQPIVIEGYSTQIFSADQLVTSRWRALLVTHYLEKHYHLNSKNIGTIALNSSPPASSGKNSWNGVCIVLLPVAKKK